MCIMELKDFLCSWPFAVKNCLCSSLAICISVVLYIEDMHVPYLAGRRSDFQFAGFVWHLCWEVGGEHSVSSPYQASSCNPQISCF